VAPFECLSFDDFLEMLMESGSVLLGFDDFCDPSAVLDR
jgi:hypothetical protein